MNKRVNKLSDEDILKDMLDSQKYITTLYNINANECTNMELKDNMLKILREEHNIQTSVFQELQVRGMYSTLNAEKQKVDEVNTKFQAIAKEL